MIAMQPVIRFLSKSLLSDGARCEPFGIQRFSSRDSTLAVIEPDGNANDDENEALQALRRLSR